jgi:hypothetical protein
MTVVRHAAAVLSIAAVFLGISVSVTQASATVQDFPFAFGVLNPCASNSIVHLTGTIREVSNNVFPPSGSERELGQLFIMGSGIDDLGNQYRFNNTSEDVFESFPGEIVMSTQHVEIISQGAAPNWTLNFLFHLTIDANGNITTFIDTSTSECRG